MSHVHDAVTSRIDIDAPREVVWAILRDVERYPEWNPFNVEMTTTLELGTPVDMQVRLRPPKVMRQVEYVTGYVEGQHMSWGCRVGPSWFITADRYQTLSDLPGGRTLYVTTDEFWGVGVRLMLAIMRKHIQRGFDGVAEGLKARAENQVGSLTPPGAAT